MWTLITGISLRKKFEFAVAQLHENNFSNKKMALSSIVTGWFFQEHVLEDFHMTGGKRFLLKRDFRNRFLTQSVKVARNLIFWAHAITTFEMVPFILLFSLYFIVFIIVFLKPITEKKIINFLVDSVNKFKTMTSEDMIAKVLIILYRNITRTNTFVTIYFYNFFIVVYKTYYWLDYFFITRPFVILVIYSYLLISIIYLFFLLYVIIIINESIKIIGLWAKIIFYKFQFHIVNCLIIMNLAIVIINNENLQTENFFKEMFVKLILFLV